MYGNSRRGQGAGGSHRTFSKSYLALSAVYANKQHLLAEGDKIILPNSAFTKLSQMTVEYPMLFRVENSSLAEIGFIKVTHCGVMEFTADEGYCYLPPNMMNELSIDESSIVTITNVSLPKATAVKFQPQEIEFIQLETNPRVILEAALRKFTCLTVGDTICIPWLDKHYRLKVTELKPANAVSIVECDCITEFEAPKDYDKFLAKKQDEAKAKAFASNPTAVNSASSSAAGGGGGSNSIAPRQLQEGRVAESSTAEVVFKPFSGSGHRLKEDGKSNLTGTTATSATATAIAVTSSSTPSTSSIATVPAPTAVSSGPPPVFQSRAAGKFAQTKGGATVFQGKGHKLVGDP